MTKGKIVLQNVLFDDAPMRDETKQMYYRGDIIFRQLPEGYLLRGNQYFDFSTYFNSLSIEKWRKYTYVSQVWLELDIVGEFEIDLMGHYVNNFNDIKKEWLGKYYFNMEQREKLIIPYPNFMCSSVVSFQITTKADTYVYGANYMTEVESEKISNPLITLATTTFKKEEYVLKNVALLNEKIFGDSELKNHFTWKIIDNGRTLNANKINNAYIEVIQNKNVGGSGGFCRGMLEALKQEKRPTHILLMDDDVEFIPESFKRVYKLLSLIRPEYKNNFISGAMLEIHERNIQHEDVGVFRNNAEHGPSKPRFDLNLWDSVIRNEKILADDISYYCGWWYCCIPTTVANENNLPLPLFIRGDDVEYSIRNHAKIITMNGICIWHEGFGNKFSASLELYQVHRNDLIVQAMLQEETSEIKLIERIKNLFWEEIYKFNYKGADLLLDAIEDYLKGPDYIKALNGEQCMKDKKAKDNVLLPITPDIERELNRDRLYEWIPLGKVKKFIYDYSCNGQRFGNNFRKNKVGTIPYGWGYNQQRMYLCGKIYAIDPVNNMYVKYERSNKEFNRLSRRFAEVIGNYNENNAKIVKEYQKYQQEWESNTFWWGYLENN